VWAIKFRKAAEKALAALPGKTRARVTDAVEGLRADPYKAQHVKPMSGVDTRRLRVGGYIVIFRIENGVLIIVVVDIGPRGAVYK